MANLSDFRVDIVPGPGLVARFPTALLVVPAFQPGQRPAIQDLLDVCKASTGTALARGLAAKVVQAPEGSLPGFAAVAEVDGRLNAFVFGAATIDGGGPAGEVQITGTDAATWVDRALGGEITSLAFGAPGSMPSAEGGLFDLGQGVVPGRGALLTLAPAGSSAARTPAPGRRAASAPKAAPAVPPPVEEPAPPEEPEADLAEAVTDFFPPVEAPVTPPAPSRSARRAPQRAAADGQPVEAAAETNGNAAAAVAAEPATAPVAETAATEPVSETAAPAEVAAPKPEPAAPAENAAPAAVVAPAARQPAIVKGVICPGPGRHFNHPDALNCWQDGLSMVHITRLLVDGARPSLGTLVLDDGAAQEVDSDFVVGRQPQDDPDVKAGKVKGITLTDPSRLVSGRHAALRLVGWEIYVEDLGSRNGTFAVAADGRETPVGAKPVLIESGASVRVGNRKLTFHSHHRVK